MQKANKNDVRKEIADLITRIKEQSDRIGNQREIPQSEVDLILYRIEELHKKTVVWAYLNELPAEVLGAQFSVLSSETKPLPADPLPLVEVPKLVEIVKPVEPIPATETKVHVAPVEHSAPSTEHSSMSQLKDVRSFIGINEKIMYIRQVFKGDDIAYNTAIEKFNRMTSWNAAQEYLSVLSGQYNWGKHDEPSEIFTQTVKRRFS